MYWVSTLHASNPRRESGETIRMQTFVRNVKWWWSFFSSLLAGGSSRWLYAMKTVLSCWCQPLNFYSKVGENFSLSSWPSLTVWDSVLMAVPPSRPPAPLLSQEMLSPFFSSVSENFSCSREKKSIWKKHQGSSNRATSSCNYYYSLAMPLLLLPWFILQCVRR